MIHNYKKFLLFLCCSKEKQNKLKYQNSLMIQKFYKLINCVYYIHNNNNKCVEWMWKIFKTFHFLYPNIIYINDCTKLKLWDIKNIPYLLVKRRMKRNVNKIYNRCDSSFLTVYWMLKIVGNTKSYGKGEKGRWNGWFLRLSSYTTYK